MARWALPLLLFLLSTHPALAAEALQLTLPLDCTPGRDCWVVNYPDNDPGPGAVDFTGGPRSYDGHYGTDFAIRDLRRMAEGVTVLAAAPGRVIGARGDVVDKPSRDPSGFCGNGVRIDHGGGWVTQYCHMKQGSLRVALDATVERGHPLGQVGLSGRTEFPHLHLTVSHRGRRVDPFTGNPAGVTEETEAPPLWREDTRATLPYNPVAIHNAGFSQDAPKGPAILDGDYGRQRLRPSAPQIYFWADVYGVQAGDQVTLRLFGPDGPLAQATRAVPKTQARRWFYIGKRGSWQDWPAGLYRGTAEIRRATAAGPIRRAIEAKIDVR